ncbi:MAG: membrane dipeptidase [Gemmatimonadetes bacterium]|nr:membrane dipeptidase [Gemmatimonadota bacterium]MDA1102002.1 membrane dipeptidase [Gemmatimonadota bacterium]
MKRRDFVRMAGAAAITPLVPGSGIRTARGTHPSASHPTPWPGYDDAIVIDALSGPIQFNIPQEGLPLGPTALDHVRRSGVTGVNLTVNGRDSETGSAYTNSVARISQWLTEVEANPEVLVLVRGVADLHQAKERGALGLILGFQDAVPFENDLRLIDDFYARGLRIVQLTYNVQNRIGTGCLAPTDGGLTALGREAVARMDDLGILVDLSHCGSRTTLDGILTSAGPVAITHSGCNTIFRHPRSKDDEALRLLADRGGVVGIYLMPFLNASGPPTADAVLRHIDHALSVCGEDHVGIGSDQGIVPLDVSGDFQERFVEVSTQRSAAGIAAPREDTIPYVPELNDARKLETIADLMAARGHSSRVIEKVLGANFARLFGEVWR